MKPDTVAAALAEPVAFAAALAEPAAFAAALAEPAAFAAALSSTESHAIMVMAPILSCVSGKASNESTPLHAIDSSVQGLCFWRGYRCKNKDFDSWRKWLSKSSGMKLSVQEMYGRS